MTREQKEYNNNYYGKVALFIRDNGGNISNKYLKERLLREHCKEMGLQIVEVIHYNELDTIYEDRFIADQLELVQKSVNNFDTLLVYDLREFADNKYALFIFLEMMTDYGITLRSACDGTYGRDFSLEKTDIVIEKWNPLNYELI